MWPFKKTPKAPSIADYMHQIATDNQAAVLRREAEQQEKVAAEVRRIRECIEADAKEGHYTGYYRVEYGLQRDVEQALIRQGFHVRDCGSVSSLSIDW